MLNTDLIKSLRKKAVCKIYHLYPPRVKNITKPWESSEFLREFLIEFFSEFCPEFFPELWREVAVLDFLELFLEFLTEKVLIFCQSFFKKNVLI